MEFSKLDELERLAAKATPGPWTPEKNHTAYDAWGESVFSTEQTHNLDNNLIYIVAACNSLPELIKMYREAEDKANNAWRILLEAQERIVEVQKRMRELERQREILAHRLADASKIRVKAYSAETWIELAEIAAKEAGE